MNKIFQILLFLIFTLFLFNNIFAQEDPTSKNKKKIENQVKEKHKMKHGKGFVDADGDGYNDNAPDHDGDGIPNGLDPDYKKGKGKKGFIDLDGDGINDNARMVRNKRKGGMSTSSDEFGNKRKGPQKGDVSGAGNNSETGKQLQGKKAKRKGWN